MDIGGVPRCEEVCCTGPWCHPEGHCLAEYLHYKEGDVARFSYFQGGKFFSFINF